MALAVPLSRFTSRVGGGSAFAVRRYPVFKIMQTLIQVFSVGTTSLRDIIVNDAKLEEFGLYVATQKKQGRQNGWAKLHKEGAHGAINIQWHSASQMLICRVVTRGGKPHSIAGSFVEFLLARLHRKIAAIHILPA